MFRRTYVYIYLQADSVHCWSSLFDLELSEKCESGEIKEDGGRILYKNKLYLFLNGMAARLNHDLLQRRKR